VQRERRCDGKGCGCAAVERRGSRDRYRERFESAIHPTRLYWGELDEMSLRIAADRAGGSAGRASGTDVAAERAGSQLEAAAEDKLAGRCRKGRKGRDGDVVKPFAEYYRQQGLQVARCWDVQSQLVMMVFLGCIAYGSASDLVSEEKQQVIDGHTTNEELAREASEQRTIAIIVASSIAGLGVFLSLVILKWRHCLVADSVAQAHRIIASVREEERRASGSSSTAATQQNDETVVVIAAPAL